MTSRTTSGRAQEGQVSDNHVISAISILPPCRAIPLRLTTDRSGAGVGIAGGDRVVKLKQDARVCRRVRAGERDEVARLERPRAPGDGELGARKVELGASNGTGAVQGNVLYTEQVVAIRDALGDGDANLSLACIPSQWK
jgi:hypothetical protein